MENYLKIKPEKDQAQRSALKSCLLGVVTEYLKINPSDVASLNDQWLHKGYFTAELRNGEIHRFTVHSEKVKP